MNILVITSLLAPYRIDWFNEIGYTSNVTVIYTKEDDKGRESSWLRRDIENFNAIKLKGIKLGSHEVCFDVLSYLKDTKYNIILFDGYGLVTNLIGIVYMKLKKRKYFINVDGGISKSKEPYIQRFIKRLSLESAYVLCSSKTTKEYVMAYGANANRCFIHPFTSLKKEDIAQKLITHEMKNSLKSKLGITESTIVLSVGRFIYGKGFDVLLRASKNISKEIGVYIIGGKPTDEYLKIKEEMNLKNIHFVDFLSKEELKKYYYAADLFVLPTRGDVWGLVINEAMACGLPVITTDKCIAGLELVKDYENGFIVPVNDDKQLSEKINIVLSDSELLNNMSQNSLKKIREYTIEKMVEENMAVFNSILRRK